MEIPAITETLEITAIPINSGNSGNSGNTQNGQSAASGKVNSLGLNQGAGNGTEAAQSATAGSTPLNMYYTIQSGDTLWKISEKFYGTGMYWEKIYQDNKDRISNPNKIYAGQEIVIQMTTLTSAETAERKM